MAATATLKTLLLGEDRGTSKMLTEAGASAEKTSGHMKHMGSVVATAAKAFVAFEAVEKVGEFLKTSTEAAVEDQAAQRKLALALHNTTGATKEQISSVNEWLGAQSMALGVSKDDLMPAFQRLAESTGSVTKAQREMKVALDVSAGTGKSLSVVSAALMKANNGTTASLSRLGLKTKDAAGKTLTLNQALTKMSQTFKGQAQARAQSFQGQMDRLHSTLHEVEVKIGAGLIPVLSGFANIVLAKVVPAVETFASWWEKSVAPALTKVAHIIGGVLGPVMAGLGRFIEKNSAFMKPFAMALGGVAIAIGVVTLATAAFSAALNSTGIPLIIIGIAALIAGLVVLYERSAKFRDIIGTVGQIITTQVWPIIKKFAAFVTGTLVPAIVKIAQKIGQNLKPIFDQLVQTFQAKVLPAMQKLFAKFQQWQPAIQKVIGFVLKLEGKWLEFQAKILGKVLPVVIKLIGWLISKLVPAIINTITFVAKVVTALVSFGSALGTAAGKVADFAGKVATQVGNVVKFFVQLPGKILHGIGNLTTLLFQKGKDLITGLVNGVKSAISSAGSAISGLIHKIPGLRAETGRGTGLSLGQQILAGLVDGIQNGWVRAKVALGKVMDYIKAQTDKIKGLMSAKAGVVSSLQGFGSSVFGATFTDAEGNDVAPGTSSLIGYQSQQLAQAQQLKGDISKLLKMGLSKSLIMQMVNAGPSGMANIHALAQGSAADVAQLNSLNAQTNAALTAAGSAAGGSLYNAQIHEATKDRNAAQSIAHEIEKMLRKQDKNTIVEIHLEGKTLQMSLLQLKRNNGGKKLGLT